MVPSRVFFTKGVGVHREKLQSFESALRDAEIERFNLVKVSSIFPPHCKIISRQKGVAILRPGQIVYVVLASNATDEPHRMISASIGLAVPAARDIYGYLSEHHAFGQSERQSGYYAEDLAATMLASTLGIPFNPDTDYDERREVYRMSGKIVESRSITQSAIADRTGKWTTVVAAAVFV